VTACNLFLRFQRIRIPRPVSSELSPLPAAQPRRSILWASLAALDAHRRSVLAGAMVLLAGFAVTAVAIAPLAPDAEDLPRRLLTESLAVPGVQEQAEALAGSALTLVRNETMRAGDTADGLLARLGVTDAEAARFLRSDRTVRMLFTGRSGKRVQAVFDEQGRLVELVARFAAEDSARLRTHFTRLSVRPVPTASGRQWLAQIEAVPFSAQARLASGTIRSSLFAASDDAGVPDSVAVQLAEIFGTEIDFHRELRKGDSFSVVYEALTADGEPVSWHDGVGRVLAAEFINAGRAHHAVWYQPTGAAKGGYYGLDGQSRQRSFLASPLEFSRVTSGFANRFHPILRTWRQHLGVDYGAPMGTPVRTVGAGTVEFAGWQNGYGNVVVVQHDKGRETLYAHLSKMAVHKGQKVEQGQHIGDVGRTGWATGPHLHFEFRIAGAHQDPLQIAKNADVIALDAAGRAGFEVALPVLKTKLELAESLAGTDRGSSRFE
jgi:murein DD-endopeptidase MepM/ murein hydrolase activator NlpD